MLLNNERKTLPLISYRRDWRKYSKEKLIFELSLHEMDWKIEDVQSNWNKIEEILIKTTDKLAPMCEYMDKVSSKSQAIPTVVNRKLHQRKKLLARLRQNPNEELRKRVKNLNVEDWLNLSLIAFKLRAKSIFLIN